MMAKPTTPPTTPPTISAVLLSRWGSELGGTVEGSVVKFLAAGLSVGGGLNIVEMAEWAKPPSGFVMVALPSPLLL